ncbi:MAG: tRNA pseudouridine(38-40) synthase TruA [Halobacteriota archaeon]|nr:tRNA pseudouridine(38-40) synthase TruA [Halobacteriota archaeon]
MRFAFKLMYLGTDYHGFQIQPDMQTVEGELIKALIELGIFDDPMSARYSAAGRTDRGVHAIGQVIAFDTDKIELATPRIINSKLSDSIRIWARAEVPDDFDPRRSAIRREYRYFFYRGNLNLQKIRSASRLLIGTHDFANFSINEGKSTVRTVESVEVRVNGDFLSLDIVADSFARSMVRKIAFALSMIGTGESDEGWLARMLNPNDYREGIEHAPAYGLVLKNVTYKGIEFIEDEYSKKKALQNLNEGLLWYGTMFEVVKEMREMLEVKSVL